MEIEEVRHFDAFLELEPSWSELLGRSQRNSFFLSHAWFRCCWPDDPDTKPLILLIREGGRLVGIAPLQLRHTTWRIFPVRMVDLMHNQDSPFADVILARTESKAVFHAVIEHLVTVSGWHLLSFNKLTQGSETDALLSGLLDTRPHLRTGDAVSPVLISDGTWSEFWSSRTQRFRKTVRNVINRLERLGQVSVEDLGSSATPTQCLDIFRRVAQRSWKANLPVSILRNPSVARFFEELTQTLRARAQLRFWVLSIDGEPVATEYHVQDGDAVYALRSDFDERLRDASPGAYLNYAITRSYFDEGVRRYEMGPGDAEYKRRWATEETQLDTVWVFNRTPYARALYQLERRAVPGLRTARAWLPRFTTRTAL